MRWWGEAGLDAAFPFPFALAAAAADGSSDLREEADGGRLLVRRLGSAADAAALMEVFAAGACWVSEEAKAAAAGEAGGVVLVLRFSSPPGAPPLACGSFCVSVTPVLAYHEVIPPSRCCLLVAQRLLAT